MLACLASTGCRTLLHPSEAFIGPGYQPTNVYTASLTLPADVKRVLVLPITVGAHSATLNDARERFEPLLAEELLKTKRFEVVSLTPEECRGTTGRDSWKGSDALPADFFSALQQKSGCDAVLFCELTAFKGYAPMVVGWRMKLVDARSRQTIWAGDEIFDGGKPTVMNGVRRYQLNELQSLPEASAGWIMENSPKYFGEYTLAMLLDTLPAR